jgi:hypothetical protein
MSKATRDLARSSITHAASIGRASMLNRLSLNWRRSRRQAALQSAAHRSGHHTNVSCLGVRFGAILLGGRRWCRLIESNKGVEHVLDNAGDRRSLPRHGGHELRVRRDLIGAILQSDVTKRLRVAMSIFWRPVEFPRSVASVRSAKSSAMARASDSVRL